MTIVSDLVLIESKSARDSQLERLSHDSAQDILNRVKSLYFALWKGIGTATTEQLADFYEVPEVNIRQLIKPHQKEFESDGLKVARSKELKDASNPFLLATKTNQLTIWTPRAALRLGMLLKNSTIAASVRTSLLDAVEYVIPAQAQEIERMKLELELIKAKQHYQDTGYAIQLSTSAAILRWLRGETCPPKEIEYRDRFLDSATGREIGSTTGRSLTQLITDAGLNPKSTRDRNRVKKILKCYKLDYDKMQGWSSASYLREYPVLEDGAYEQALKAVLAEVVEGESQPNLFVHSLSQPTLSPGATTGKLKGEE
jgi:hypothetical protein